MALKTKIEDKTQGRLVKLKDLKINIVYRKKMHKFGGFEGFLENVRFLAFEAYGSVRLLTRK